MFCERMFFPVLPMLVFFSVMFMPYESTNSLLKTKIFVGFHGMRSLVRLFPMDISTHRHVIDIYVCVSYFPPSNRFLSSYYYLFLTILLI